MKRFAALAGSWLGILDLAGTQMGGCGSSGGGIGFIPATVVVVNTTDSFTVSITGFDFDGTVDRNWTCTATQANLTIGSSMSSGTVDVTVYDDTGAVVYNNTHNAIGGLNVQTRTGVAGTWRVVIDFDDATIAGAIVLEADTPPTLDSISLGSAFGTSDLYTFHADWGAVTADVSVGSVSSGNVVVRIWHGGQNPQIDAPFYEATVGSGGLSDTTPAGSAGTWTIELDFSGASLAGSVSITSN